VDSAARPKTRSDQSKIADLRGISFEKLIRQATAGENDVAYVVSRIVDQREQPSSVRAMMFNSTI